MLVYIENTKNPEVRTMPVTRVTTIGLAGLEKVINKHFPICPPCDKVKKSN